MIDFFEKNNIPNCLIDLHLHIDGSLSVDAVKDIIHNEKLNMSYTDEEISKMLSLPDGCRNLNDYLDRFELPISLLQSEYSLERATLDICQRLLKIGCIYAELRFAPQKHCIKGLSQEDAIKAVIRGMKKSPLPCGLILCCMREGWDNSRENLETVDLAVKLKDYGVCGLDLAGAEALYPNQLYKDLFTKMNRSGLPYTIHSGEALGAGSVKIALEFGAKRIGHGIRSYEDEKTLKYIATNKIPLEICPTSNLNTCIFSEYSQLPIKRYLENGVILTINSDNMSISNTDVRQELETVARIFNLDINNIRQILINSAKASFATDNLKDSLIKNIYNCFNQ